MTLKPRAPLARLAREEMLAGRPESARRHLARLITDVTGLSVASVHINTDHYSLNSLNGLVTLGNGVELFFKYHQEQGEGVTLQEYYNAELLQRAGYLVDAPRWACGEPGRQILLYRRRTDRRFADVCRELDAVPASDPAVQEALAVQRNADRHQLACMLGTLRPATLVDAAHRTRQPVHQLFHHRLAAPPLCEGFGGRVREYYVGKMFRLGDIALTWSELADATWVINGTQLSLTLREAFRAAARRLTPGDAGGVVVAHGDDHNANIWYAEEEGSRHLELFDPAFAGDAVPALLAPVKATFHNVFAHPLWLYEPTAANPRVVVRHHAGVVEVEHDWELTPVRAGLLASKLEEVWAGLLHELARRDLLEDDWVDVMNLALFTCPTLVVNLADGARTGASAALGLAIAMALASPEVEPRTTGVLRAWQAETAAQLGRQPRASGTAGR